MKSTKVELTAYLLVFALGFLFGPGLLLASDEKPSGQPFQLLQQQIDAINQKISQLDQQNQQITALQQEVEELTNLIADMQKNGAYGYEVSRNSINDITVEPGETATIRIQCPFGKRIVGGSARSGLGLVDLTLLESYPAPGECEGYDTANTLVKVPMDEYVAFWRNNTGISLTGFLDGTAICIGEEYTGQLQGGCSN